MKYQTYILFGAPGSGKGTQGRTLGSIPRFFHCACGDVFRAIDTRTKVGRAFLEYSSKGQLVLPAPLRERDRISAGQTFDIERIEAGQYLLKRQPVPDNEGLVDWLLACPEKNWFQPLPSELTDSL